MLIDKHFHQLAKQRRTRTNCTGFTLIEMTVAAAVFSIAVLLTMSALISLSNESRKAQATRAVMSNLGVTIESMSRAIRMGKNFQCGCGALPITSTYPYAAECPMNNLGGNGTTCLVFTPIASGSPLPIIYRHNTVDKYIERSEDGGVNFARFTSPDTRVESMKFFVVGTGSGKQPAVTMIVGGVAGSGKTQTDFNIQTTVSVRTPNF